MGIAGTARFSTRAEGPGRDKTWRASSRNCGLRGLSSSSAAARRGRGEQAPPSAPGSSAPAPTGSSAPARTTSSAPAPTASSTPPRPASPLSAPSPTAYSAPPLLASGDPSSNRSGRRRPVPSLPSDASDHPVHPLTAAGAHQQNYWY